MRVRVPLLPAWLRYLGVVAVIGFVFYTSILTPPPVDPIIPVRPDLLPLDKWRHFLAYGAVAGSLTYATTDWNWSARQLAVAVVLVTTLYGVGIELWQSQIPNRYFSLGDAYANALGAVLVTPWYLVRSRVRQVRVLDELALTDDR